MGTGRLPAQLTTFVGRVREVATVEDALDGGRLVTLTGAGGCGKTRLAVHVAERRSDPHPDGIWFIDLSTVADDASVPRSVADAVGAVNATDEAIIAAIEQRAALLLLDNCEHVIEVCASLADAVLRACPALTILATSREPLGVAGEVVYRVPSLAHEDAAALFTERARRARAAAPEADADVVDDICDRLDGIPLAIELAAARTRVFSATQIRDGLHDRFRLLTGGARTSVQRQQTLQASVDWSYDLLQDAERQVLRRLSVFAGGFPLEGAEAVATAGSVERHHVLDLLSQLIDKSLVQSGDDDRFRLLETVRQYAAARLAEAGEAEDTWRRHHGWCLRVAQRRVADGESDEDYRARVLGEQENIRRALQWSSELDDPMPLVQLVLGMNNWWSSSRRMTEGATWSALAAERTPEGDDRLQSVVLRACAGMNGLAGRWREALGPARDAVAAARRAEEPKALVWALIQASMVSRNAGAHDPSLLEEAMALSIEIGYDRARAMALFSIGFGLARDDADAERGLTYALEALDVARWTQFREVERLAEPLVSFCRLLLGELDAVIVPLEASVAALRNAGEGFFLSNMLTVLVHCAGMTGDAAALERHVAELAELAADSPDKTIANQWRLGVAFAAMFRGMWHEAAALFGDPPFLEEWTGSNRAGIESTRAMCECLAGDVAAARRSLAEVERANLPSAMGIPAPLIVGLIALAEGDVDRADDGARRALALLADPSLASSRLVCLELLASVAARRGRADEAARILGGQAAYARSVGAVTDWVSRHWPFDGARELRAELGHERFDELFAEGAALSWDDLVAYLGRGRGRRGRPASGWGSVTPTEHQVVALVADGRTNAEIATQLFMSVPTVKSHLTHVFAKLGVSSRSELTAAFVRRDISDL
jgi:predicted ATPase/DNA-binding CsgD family transcriptional regulator